MRENQRQIEVQGEDLQKAAEALALPDLASQQSHAIADGSQRFGSRLDSVSTQELRHFLLCTVRVRFFNRLLDFPTDF